MLWPGTYFTTPGCSEPLPSLALHTSSTQIRTEALFLPCCPLLPFPMPPPSESSKASMLLQHTEPSYSTWSHPTEHRAILQDTEPSYRTQRYSTDHRAILQSTESSYRAQSHSSTKSMDTGHGLCCAQWLIVKSPKLNP